MSTDQQLTLGTLFTAKVHENFASEMNKLRNNVKGLVKDMTNLDSSTKKVAASTKKVEAEEKKATVTTNKYSGAVKTLGKSLKTVASYGGAAILLNKFTEGIKNGLGIIMDYNQGLKNLQAISGSSNAQLEIMGDKMEYVATITKFSTTELAEGMVLLTQSGFTAGESVASLDAVTTLATGTLSSMLSTTDLMTTSIRAFGLEAVESGRVADVFANAVNKSKATIDKFRTAFNYVASAAAQANVKIEEVSAGMMNLFNNGMRASSVGTGLRQVLSRLVAPNRKLRNAFDEHGIALEKITPKTEGLESALKNLTPVLIDGETGLVDMAKAYELFGLRGAQAISILIKSVNTGQFEEALERVYEVGTAAEMSAKQQEGLAVRWKQLKDRAGVLAIAIGDKGLAGAMGVAIDAGRKLLGWLIDFVNTEIGGMVTSIALLTAGIIAMGAGFSFAGALIAPFVATMIGMAGPITVIVTVIAGLTVALGRLAGAQMRAARAAEKQAEVHLATSQALEIHQLNMKKLADNYEKGGRHVLAYKAALKRLANEYPDLREELLNYGNDFEKVYKILENAKIDNDGEAAKGALKNIERYYAIHMKNLKTTLNIRERWKEERKKLFGNDTDTSDIDKKFKIQKSGLEGMARAFGIYIRSNYESQKAEGMSVKAIKETNLAKLEELGITKKSIEYLDKKTAAIYKSYERDIEFARKAKDKANKGAEKETKESDFKKELKAVKASLKQKEEIAKKEAFIQKTKVAGQENAKEEFLKIEKELNAKVYENKDKAYDNLADQYKELENGKSVVFMDFLNSRKLEELEHDTEVAKNTLDTYKATIKAKEKLGKKRTAEKVKESKAVVMAGKDLAKREITLSQTTEDIKLGNVQRRLESEIGYEHQAILDVARIKAETANTNLAIQKRTFKIAEREWKKHPKEMARSYASATQNVIEAEKEVTKTTQATKIAVDEVNKLRDSWDDIVSGTPNMLAGGITSGLASIARGAKTAEEAMKEFGISTIEWLAKVIIQQQILNALQGINWGGSVDLNKSVPMYNTMYSNVAHSGGIIGKSALKGKFVDPSLFENAPKFHGGGIVGGEVPIIAKEKEGVFTEEQMKALAPVPNGTGKTYFNIVNKTDARIERMSSNTRFDNEGNKIMDVVLEGLAKNKRNFKRNLQGMMNG